MVVPRNPGQGRVVPRPQPIRERERIIDHDRSRSVIRHPGTGWDGRPITHRPHVGSPTRDHVTIINNTTIINNVHHHNRYETVRGRYYWHEYGGHRYAHYYDMWGFHWYGWYVGSSYFWVRHYEDRYWWYDPGYGRWCYWHNGYWWWQNPTNVTYVYVYVNDRYYRYEDAQGGAVLRPEPPKPADPAQPAPPAEQPAEDPTFYSADGARMVQIFGERKEAFLYDASGEEPAYLAYLGDSVVDVQFSDTTGGEPLLINTVIERKTTAPDGTETVTKTFKMFDGDGAPIGLPVAPPADSLEQAPAMDQLQSPEKGW